MDWKEEFWDRFLTPIDILANEAKAALALKNENLPSSLYKYFGVQDYNLSALRARQIYLSSASDFNDPYDCSLMLNPTDALLPNSRILPIAVGNASTESPTLWLDVGSDREATLSKLGLGSETIRQLSETVALREKEMAAKTSQEIAAKLRHGYGICCFSERLDSVAMWSHYAQKHEGFCVEYDIGSLSENSIIRNFLFPVYYRSEIFDWTKYFNANQERGRFLQRAGVAAAVRKALDWEYEHEYRLVHVAGPGIVRQLIDAPQIKGIFVGAKANQATQNELAEIAKELGVKLSRIVLTTNRFELTPQVIEGS